MWCGLFIMFGEESLEIINIFYFLTSTSSVTLFIKSEHNRRKILNNASFIEITNIMIIHCEKIY